MTSLMRLPAHPIGQLQMLGVKMMNLHIAVYDKTGDITGYDVDVKGQRTSSVIEVFSGVSKNPSAKTVQGGGNYYPDVIFRSSGFHLLDRSYFCWF